MTKIKMPVHNIVYQECTPQIINTLKIFLDEWEVA
jgi:hypothetical protein